MPPFTLAALEAALAGRPGIPAEETQTLARQVYDRYDRSGPADSRWRVRQVIIFKPSGGIRLVCYDLCRADLRGGVFFDPAQRTAQALANTLNELEGTGPDPEDMVPAQASRASAGEQPEPGRLHMKKSANARFVIKSWDEKPYSEGQDLPKLTKASVVKAFTGDIEGEGQVEYLMMYRSDGTAAYVGLERISGRIDGRTGSFVLQRVGVFEGGQATETYSVIPGSATGDLRGLVGDGKSSLGHGTEYPFVLDYELA